MFVCLEPVRGADISSSDSVVYHQPDRSNRNLMSNGMALDILHSTCLLLEML